ncbi:hypothetical protein RMSM_04904 [Rhodopirellula maiorica SM1]|uniref:Uncharacterized protein n=1 Tax=Rhodopirellula maiorica SM1 TaxID=1265738 RepID=M5RW24_9BACT|nr:hypothetical protein [Rhodopirellula maiorica]EMI18154.1 hypothetical protein RMSM_04904 [Rhodopirellula maiorica SM1]
MASIDECCILIPVSTLEDFPKHAGEEDARSLLAAWTVLWHPELVAASQQTPTWYRADSPPEFDDAPRVIVVPTLSVSQLPADFEANCRAKETIQWITGVDRQAMLDALGLSKRASSLQTEHRTVGPEDFFALGYAMLQIQVMTRRLRYTSNLDEIHFQNKLVTAADAFVAGDADACVAAMHDSYDALAEERDHYFSSDPHLVDLTLLSDSTLPAFFKSLQNGDDVADSETNDSVGDSTSVLATPRNVLIDAPIAGAISASPTEDRQRLVNLIRGGEWGWAGGGLGGDVSLDAMTYSDTENAITQAYEQTATQIGLRPPVYARFSGTTPTDMTKVIASLGVDGMISVDFENGSGFGDEAKVVRNTGGVELHALTAKPIDASGESAFLALGPRLGEAIDSGEIATGLMVHWTGYESDSYHDVRRVASWSLVLGRFWTLAEYFRSGEQPYHHDPSGAATSGTDNALVSQVVGGSSNAVSSMVEQAQQSIAKQNQANLQAMIALASGKPCNGSVDDCEQAMLASIGLKPSQHGGNLCLINPTPCPVRHTVAIDGTPVKEDHIYAATGSGKQSMVTVDVPAFGFSVARNEAGGGSRGRSIGQRLRDVVSGTGKLCAIDGMLQNAFIEIAIDPQTGGIKGGYSGQSRGNRFSMRLVGVEGTQKKKSTENESQMVCDQMKTIVAKAERGVIRTTGHLTDSTGAKIGAFELDYQVTRGNRMLDIHGKIDVISKLEGNPWQNYFAARCAVANEAVSYRMILRDKMHRTSSRRIVAPLGVLMDEIERQTVVASAGLAYHRRVGDRFLDTLLQVQGETQRQFSLHYGFDLPSPVLAARSVATEPLHANVETVSSDASRGWLIHAAPNTVLVANLDCMLDQKGKFLAIVRLIQTRSQTCNTTVRFCRNVSAAVRLDNRGSLDLDALATRLAEQSDSPRVEFSEDRIKLTLSGHEVVDVLVQFDA